MINCKHYAYKVRWSAEDNEYVAVCAEFPSLSFLANEPDKALKGIVATVSDVVEDMTASGEDVPKPISDREYSGRFQVRIPPEMHRLLALAAAEQGVSLNRYISSKLS